MLQLLLLLFLLDEQIGQFNIKTMESIRKFFKQFDMFAAPATLRAREEAETQSLCAGIFSLLIIIGFTYVFVITAINIAQYNSITSTQTQTSLPGDDVSAQGILFGLMVNNMNWTEASQYFSISVTAFAITQIFQIQLQNCQARQWSLLGDDYQTTFSEFGLADFLCPTSVQHLNLAGTFKKARIKEIKISVRPCRNNLNSTAYTQNCINSTLQQSAINQIITQSRSILVEMYILDQTFNVSAKNPINYFINNDNRITFTLKRGTDNTIQFGSVQITTDTMLLPFNNYQVVNGSFVNNLITSNYQILSLGSQPFVNFNIIMGRRMIYINRTVGKLDNALSYVGGLFSIIMGFLALFMASYNQYRYQIMVAEGSFNYSEDGQKIKQNDFMFHTYVKYAIFDWINTLFCTELKWPHCQKIDETRKQVNCQMDVVRLLRKIRNLQAAIMYLLHEKQKMCLTLFQPPTLQQIRRNRLIQQYYDAIIEGKPAVTVEDIQLAKDTLKFGVKLSEDKFHYMDNEEFGSQINLYDEPNLMNENPDPSAHTRIGTASSVKLHPDRSNILEVVLSRFPEYEQQAGKIVLPEQLQQAQDQIAKAFFTMDPKIRAVIQQKIPIKIIHRLKKKMDFLQINGIIYIKPHEH